MLEQHGHHRLLRHIVVSVQAELFEVLVLSHEFRGLVRQQIDEPFEIGLRKGCFKVFDDIELDVSVAQDLQRAPRLASARVVIDNDVCHGSLLDPTCQ